MDKLKYLLLYLLVNSVRTDCSNGCLVCKFGGEGFADVCMICDTAQLYYLSG